MSNDNDSGDGHGRTSRDSSPVDEFSSDFESFPKRRRRRRSTVDRICELPDSLLVHILSFLPIEDAIRTQVLSKRWKYLCTYLPSLEFRSYGSDYVERDVGEFADFVDKTLILCKCSKLKKFGVHFGYSEYEHRIDSKVNTWIRFAAGKGTEVLHLHLHSAEVHMFEDCHYELPQHLYSNSALRELHFSLCRVTPKRGVDWNSLKELSIGHAILSDEEIQKILV